MIERLHIAAVFMTVVGRFPVQWLPCSVCVILLCRRRSRVICFESYVLCFFLNQTQPVFVNVICYNLVQNCIL